MKPTLLLLPGLGADEALFQYQMANLKDIADPVCVDYRDSATGLRWLKSRLGQPQGRLPWPACP